MRVLVQILGPVRMSHAGRISADDVEVGTGAHPSLGMPLDFGRTRVHHRRWEDGENGGFGIQHSLFQYGLMLLHSDWQRDVVVLGPSACFLTVTKFCWLLSKQSKPSYSRNNITKWMKEKNRFFETSGQQLLSCILHEKRVSVMNRISQLKCKHCVGLKQDKKVHLSASMTS